MKLHILLVAAALAVTGGVANAARDQLSTSVYHSLKKVRADPTNLDTMTTSQIVQLKSIFSGSDTQDSQRKLEAMKILDDLN
ncbi:hypothetical protein SAMN04490244_1223 [Tranquillimonas rosea]|uniref:Uncharacterized protein n=1 Tax=Tranquillimonas rosea TaxID=641238 RepID=A0A1H9X9P5_9RHOB|nr:hypothetical protein [Tranquillimonas rosea]SES42771.1 hypothetical protein SAMN04490244_1223 [Tranquillimonas rosea]